MSSASVSFSILEVLSHIFMFPRVNYFVSNNYTGAVTMWRQCRLPEKFGIFCVFMLTPKEQSSGPLCSTRMVKMDKIPLEWWRTKLIPEFMKRKKKCGPWDHFFVY